MNQQALDAIETNFRRTFTNSHLIISHERSIGRYGTTQQYVLYINFDELAGEDLKGTRVQEYFEDFVELEKRLEFLMYREACAVTGIREEIKQLN